LSGCHTVGHAGSLRGWASDYVWAKERDLAVVVLSNRNDVNWFERSREALIIAGGLPPDPSATPRLIRADAPKAVWQEEYGNEELGIAITFCGAPGELKYEARWLPRRHDGLFARSLGAEPFVFEALGLDKEPPHVITVREGNVAEVFKRRASDSSPSLAA